MVLGITKIEILDTIIITQKGESFNVS